MDIFGAEAQKRGFLVEVDGRFRYAGAYIFKARGGLIWVESGWCDPYQSKHPFHYAKGPLEGDGPWRIANLEIRLLTEDDDEVLNWIAGIELEREQQTGADSAELLARADLALALVPNSS